MPHHRLLSLALACCILAVPGHAVALPAPAPCTFTLGFRALHDRIPRVVGDCTATAAYGASGSALQPTTWINGPEGLQARPNDRRFAREGGGEYHGNPCSILPTPADMGEGWTRVDLSPLSPPSPRCIAVLTPVGNEHGLKNAFIQLTLY